MKYWLPLLLGFTLALGFHGLQKAWAHDMSRPDLNEWFGSLRSGKGPCCGGPQIDATTVEDVDWDTKDGHYRVRLDGNWIDVPDEAVITEPNKFGRTLVWPFKGYTGEVYIRCFLPGGGT